MNHPEVHIKGENQDLDIKSTILNYLTKLKDNEISYAINEMR